MDDFDVHRPPPENQYDFGRAQSGMYVASGVVLTDFHCIFMIRLSIPLALIGGLLCTCTFFAGDIPVRLSWS